MGQAGPSPQGPILSQSRFPAWDCLTTPPLTAPSSPSHTDHAQEGLLLLIARWRQPSSVRLGLIFPFGLFDSHFTWSILGQYLNVQHDLVTKICLWNGGPAQGLVWPSAASVLQFRDHGWVGVQETWEQRRLVPRGGHAALELNPLWAPHSAWHFCTGRESQAGWDPVPVPGQQWWRGELNREAQHAAGGASLPPALPHTTV